MLSTKVITNSGQAGHYYGGQDNYYEQGEAQQNSQWYGRGAQQLGLSGQVDTSQFQQLLQGQLPDGQQLGFQTRNGGVQHRPGFDLTFSAPKSVSMLALMTPDDSLRRNLTGAVQQAAQRTLDHIEQECAQARVTHNGQTEYEATGNLTAALYLHDLSREADPQLHVHSVIMNLTQRQDGQWRSLASQARGYGANQDGVNGFIERVRSSKNQYGLLFRHELAYQLKQLNVPVRITDGRQGFFEIDGVPDALIEAFSLRSRQIQSHLREQGLEGDKAADMANVATRQPKEVERGRLMHQWVQKARDAGYPVLEHMSELTRTLQAPEQSQQPEPDTARVAQQALNQAMAHLADRQVQATATELMNLMARYSDRPVGLQALQQVIHEAERNGQLLPVPSDDGHITHYVPAELAQTEQASWQALQRHAPARLQCTDASVASYLAQQSKLTDDQRQAVHRVFTDQASVQLVDGPVGNGKTSLAPTLAELGRLQNLNTVFVSGSHADREALQHHVEAQPQSWRAWFKGLLHDRRHTTAAGLLRQPERFLNPSQPSLVVVDDAQRLPANQLHQLTRLTEQHAVKLVFMGDHQDMAGPGPGEPYHQWVREQGSPSLSRTDQTSTAIHASVWTTLNRRLTAINDQSERHRHMAVHYAHRTDGERAGTQLLAPSRESAAALNQAVRHELNNQGVIDATTETTVTTLRPVRLSEPANQLARSYPKGHWLRFEREVTGLGIQAGEYWQIKARHYQGDRNTVVLASPRGDRRVWNPKRQPVKPGRVRLFEPQQRAVAVGDRLRWQGQSKPFQSGQTLAVTAVTPDAITIQTPQSQRYQLNRHRMADWHVDHAYAVTPYQLRHRPQRVIADQPAASTRHHQRQLYFVVQQARQHAWVYTDDRKRFLDGLKRELPGAASALDKLVHGDSSHQERLMAATANALPDGSRDRAQAAVEHALNHLSERHTTFSQAAVMERALTHALGEVSTEQLAAAVQQAEQAGQLVRGLQSTDGVRWTTREALDEERTIIQLAQSGQGELDPLTSDRARNALSTRDLKPEHAQVLKQWLANRDRVSLIQGYAGTGKTTLMAQAQEALQQDGLTLHCLAPTHTAVKALRDRGLTADTLDRHLTTNQGGQADVLVVDENSMTANRKMLHLLQQARANEQRLLLVGDSHQHTAIEAGHPHQLLQQAGIPTYQLTDIQRQRNPELHDAVQSAYRGDYQGALTRIDHRIVEQTSTEERLTTLARAYAGLSPSERAQTLVITLGNREREQLNAKLQQVLTAPLNPERQTVTILTPRHLSRAEGQQASCYRRHDWLRFQQPEPHLGLQAGDYAQVLGHRPDVGGLTLKRPDHETVIWRPRDTHQPECYHAQTRTVQTGDVIEWTRSDRARGLNRAELARVEQVSAQRLQLQPVEAGAAGLQPSGSALTVNPHEACNQHWDLAYAVTGYSAQGMTVKRVLMEASSQHRHLLTQRAVLIGLSRAVDNFALYTDDKAQLTQQVLARSGDEPSALATIGQAPQPGQASPSSVTEQAAIRANPQATRHPQQTAERDQRPDARQVVAALHDRTEKVAEHVLGTPKDKTGSHWVYSWSEQMGGANHHPKGGSLYLAVEGPQRGCWFSFKAGEGGNLLQLMQTKYNLTFREALQWGQELAGGDIDGVAFNPNQNRSHPAQGPKQREWSDQQHRSVAYAQQLVQNSRPLTGTPAETYLREHRGIQMREWPKSLRYHPGVYSKRNDAIHPALLAVATNSKGETQAVQAIFLDNNSGNKAQDVTLAKQTWGVTQGASVALNGRSGRHGYLAEGPETGLSVQMARPEGTTHVTLGQTNFQHFPNHQGHESLTLCCDHDPHNQGQPMTRAVNALKQRTQQLWQVRPQQPGTDFNDLLRQQGTNAVGQTIARAEPLNRKAHQLQLAVQTCQQQPVMPASRQPQPSSQQQPVKQPSTTQQPVQREREKE